MNYTEQTLSAIVLKQHGAAAIFEKYELDFCCRGKQTLAEACGKKNIAVDNVVTELNQMSMPGNVSADNIFVAMTAAQLIDYIVLKHHFYVKQSVPIIYGHLEKVARKHGDTFPYMRKVYEIFGSVAEEMLSHMEKEEAVLFPRIREAEKIAASGAERSIPGSYISKPIEVMEAEHEMTGEWMAQIHQLTNNFNAPEDACTTFRVSLAELRQFEQDLHQHVHLENYVLFPKALSLGVYVN